MELLERVTSPAPINSEDVSQYQQERNISLSSNNAGSTLSDDITAAFKTREEQRESPVVEETTNQQEGLSFADDILATLNKKKEFENSTLINSTEISETSTKPESVLGGFQNDILSVIGSLGSNETSPVPETNENDSETVIKEERPVTPIVTNPSGKQPTKRPQRKAPPPPPPGAKVPPSGGNQTSESSESNSPICNESPTPDALEKPPTLTESISTSNDTTNDVLPDEKIVETEKNPESVPNDIKLQTVKKVSTETEVKQERRTSGAPKVVRTLTASSPSGKRRRVPPPPPQSLLTSNTKTSEETRNHSPKNSAIPDVPSLDVNDKDELNAIDKPISVNKDAYGKDKPSRLERQHKKEKDGLKTSGGWKPQGKNTNKTSDSAPRRTPPQPPSSSPKNMQPKVKVQKVKRPGRNIPPPPSIPLPPPPTMRTPLSPKSPPPTIPLPPPPVLTVLKEEQDAPPPAGNTSPSSKLESNPTISTHVNKENSTVETVTNPHDPENQVNSTEDTKIEELSKILDGNNSDIPNIESKSKPQPSPRQQSTHIEKHDSQEEKKSDSSVEMYQTNVETKVPTLSSLDSDNKTLPPPKKTKPPIKPKPKHISVGSLNQDRDLKPHPPLQSSSSNIKNTQLPQSPQIKKLRGNRPTPPERTSSLPNTPDPSPSPSPSPIPRSTLTNSPLPSSTINRTPSTSPVPHSPPAIPSSAINRTPSTSPIPHSPIPFSAINRTPSTSPIPHSPIPSSAINRTPSTSPIPHSPPPIPSSTINKTPSTSPIPHSPIPSSAINRTPSTSPIPHSPIPSSAINRTPSTSPIPHSPPPIPSSTINKTPSTSPIPHSPIPSSAINKTPSTSPVPSSVLNPHMPSPPASPNPSSTPLNTENQGNQKKPPPARPAPPNIVRKTSKEEADEHNKPVSPTKAKVNSLMSSMKKLDGRPQRDSTPDNITSETQESVSKPDSTHPVPARRTRKDMNHPDRKSTKLPTRPPPPRITTSTTKIEKEDTSLTTQSSESSLKQPPVPKPRVLSTQSVSPESPTGSNTFYKAVKDVSATRDEELSFSSGDILIVIDSHPPFVDDGYIYGMLDDGSTGLFPLTHVELVENP